MATATARVGVTYFLSFDEKHVPHYTPDPNSKLPLSSENGGGRVDQGGCASGASCFRCGQPGHISRECPSSRSSQSSASRRCFVCQQEGHIARECPNSPGHASSSTTTERPLSADRTTSLPDQAGFIIEAVGCSLEGVTLSDKPEQSKYFGGVAKKGTQQTKRSRSIATPPIKRSASSGGDTEKLFRPKAQDPSTDTELLTLLETLPDRLKVPIMTFLLHDYKERLLRVCPDVGAAGGSAQTLARRLLVEVTVDEGAPPVLWFSDDSSEVAQTDVIGEDIAQCLEVLCAQDKQFTSDNRIGISKTLHRISAMRTRDGSICGLTYRIGRAVRGVASLIEDLAFATTRAGAKDGKAKSVLLLGPPGVGKTTLLRDMARYIASELSQRCLVIDTSNEIAGDGRVPHECIGRARRMQVSDRIHQHEVMIEAVQNHNPQVIVIDEIGTAQEVRSALTISQRGVSLVATAHGINLSSLLKNPTTHIGSERWPRVQRGYHTPPGCSHCG
eukprot:TRINITY_DN1708_c0_g1_i8.p1 TRINITY_DN1708_c0_g1~~TRINITY_DN1708_c0_g1_i8.p1  ORF type:complete len:502 (+),score=37.92 TRINITY_DN1708_c0_g1_i8:135-1640(+)